MSVSDSSAPVQRARFGLGKIGLVFACGTALFSDGYVNASSGTVNTILKRLYPTEYGKNNHGTLFSSMVFVGTVLGQLSFGYLVDRYGRKFGMLAASAIMIVGSALCAGAYGAGGSITGMLQALIAWRFLTGIGIGAEYPAGSVACSESTENPGVKGRIQHMLFVLATNCMIDVGFVVASFVPLVLLWICGENHLRLVWRLTFGLGIVPAALVLLWRLRMPSEPVRYRESAIKRNVPYGLVFRRYWKPFVGISLCWFLYDFITYPFGLFSSVIVDTVTGGSDKLTTVFAWNIVINAFYVPGCFFGALTVDWIGPKKQLMLFLMLQAIVGFAMSGTYEKLTQHIAGFAVLYGFFLSLGEAGPGDCLGLLSSKAFPTAVRGQMYGLAAAIGKIGAFCGTWAFPALINDFPEGPKQTSGPFWVGSGLAVVSALIALVLIPEAKMNGMTQMDAEFKQYLIDHGYDVSQMGTSDAGSIQERDSMEDEKKAPAV
ncbi:hypothetical protein RTBOTA2_005793 [Rhodotorula toruloides]|nr:hypothetical protein RTBOTA2_005793 [Rhodotorula toruloides]